MLQICFLLSLFLLGAGSPAQEPVTTPRNEAYLFAHMMKGDYGRLYYSVSLDGLPWTLLNDGKPVFPAYHGHASFVRGHDGRYYLVGNNGDDAPDINFWVSDDLISWKKYSDYRPDVGRTPNYSHPLKFIGAPKLYYDIPSSQYLFTWHTPSVDDPKDPEVYWASQRTLYVTSKDLIQFSDPPQKLFSWDMATIDVVVRRDDDGEYCAILKDERYPSLLLTKDFLVHKMNRLES
jgi:hypothetical protein